MNVCTGVLTVVILRQRRHSLDRSKLPLLLVICESGNRSIQFINHITIRKRWVELIMTRTRSRLNRYLLMGDQLLPLDVKPINHNAIRPEITCKRKSIVSIYRYGMGTRLALNR